MIFQNAPKSFRESKINSKKIKQNTNIDEDIQKEWKSRDEIRPAGLPERTYKYLKETPIEFVRAQQQLKKQVQEIISWKAFSNIEL